MLADSSNGICAYLSNDVSRFIEWKVPNWFEVPSLSASTWKIMEMSNNILLTSTIFRVLVIIKLVWKSAEMSNNFLLTSTILKVLAII